MPDWDADSPQLRQNLGTLLRSIREAARRREPLDLTCAQRWHREILQGLTVPDSSMVGAFRGDPGLETVEVKIGPYPGVAAKDVSVALAHFEQTLKRVVVRLDKLIPEGIELTADLLAAVLDACAWVHAEWVRIYPFANGNGRTARLWANALAMRYGLPPFVRLRPRPDDGYGAAAAAAMQGDWQPTAKTFRRMLRKAVQI